MKIIALCAGLVLVATPASAQLGRLKGLADKGKSIADVRVTEQEERRIGEQVSALLIQEYGVFQDPKVTKYVALLGSVLAQASSRPTLPWEFIVLDTEGVNAFAAPGGIVHVTKGLLGLMKNEAELAGVLAHEVIHVTEKHTVNAVQKGGLIKVASDEVTPSGGMTQTLVTRYAEGIFKNLLNNAFSREDEEESDEDGIQLANKVGYAPAGLSSALEKVAARLGDSQKEPSGLFASHPVIKDRIARIGRIIRDRKLTATATVPARYAANITFDAKPVTAVTLVPPGTRGLAGGEEKKAEEKKPEEKPKSGGGFGARLKGLAGGGSSQAQQSQTVASSGARGVNPDRDAVGGPNKSKLSITVTPQEIEAFRKGIVV
jgi:predicted Zn-dependent protease